MEIPKIKIPNSKHWTPFSNFEIPKFLNWTSQYTRGYATSLFMLRPFRAGGAALRGAMPPRYSNSALLGLDCPLSTFYFRLSTQFSILTTQH